MNPAADARMSDDERYSRQVLCAELGAERQQRLRAASVALVGCGGLGSVVATRLVGAGVGRLRLIDRDVVELSNLPRQALFDERDAAEGSPKAEAFARRLRQMNSGVTIEPVVADLNRESAGKLLAGSDIILDGTDNLETRYLINDFAVQNGLPWVYGGVVGTEGRVLAVIPGRTPCLRCLWPEPPEPGGLPTCDMVGVLNTAVGIVGNLQATEALRILVGSPPEVPRLLVVRAWSGQVRAIELGPRAGEVGSRGGSEEGSLAAPERCPCCQERRFDFLSGTAISSTTMLCGRRAIQVLPSPRQAAVVDLERLAQRLPVETRTHIPGQLVRFQVGNQEITVFSDGRALIQGTTDAVLARKLYARYVGY